MFQYNMLEFTVYLCNVLPHMYVIIVIILHSLGAIFILLPCAHIRCLACVICVEVM